MFLNVAIYAAKRLLIPFEHIEKVRNHRCLIIAGQSSAGKSTILGSLERIFTGKRLHSFNAMEDFFDSDIFSTGIWIKDEVDSFSKIADDS